ncbi:uncharacterized protein HMPREF1541_04634 [Cyphellophora europaea CBS 101466]|uniref:Roadblock/LAMTOR2 domain-containing protein n=1 Tax=Cyphellophora europaea (strain CBS 101466) TaxID=1220924 RepID=W2RV98_CYPE1|nr:uncharacterized protein HMPREF1541_04634 [Cyphellophora europaea CBS 101466]ETN40357.1 hypothetical protein HMPREF1541_04634 [Cyphellophora europaea CBS 101466]
MASLDKQSSIDATLRSLSDRPNVESTLILSRKDGSIIKTTGFTSAEKRRRAQSTAAYQAAESPAQVKDADAGNEEAIAEQEKFSPAEELAASIFQFMKAAGTLGTTLTAVSAGQDGEDSNTLRRPESGRAPDTDGTTEESEARRIDSQVQLLRLRVKHREIIIFPDPHYLCCVVQRIGKQAGSDHR